MKKITEKYKTYPFNLAISLKKLWLVRQDFAKKLLQKIDPDIPTIQHEIAHLFSLTEKLSIEEVSIITGRNRTSAVLLLKRAAKTGILERVKIKGDRKVYYRLSESMRHRFDFDLIEKCAREICSCLTEEECKEFMRINAKLTKSHQAGIKKLEEK